MNDDGGEGRGARGSDSGLGLEWDYGRGRVRGFAWTDSWAENGLFQDGDLCVWLLPQIPRDLEFAALSMTTISHFFVTYTDDQLITF